MKHLFISPDERRPLPFYLAMEEWAARWLPEGEYFFAWQVDPTVICGRNQLVDAEVDLDYCRRNNIRVVRRRSGGGCVFADRSNVMFSYICPGDAVTETFSHYTAMITKMLCSLGLDAKVSGRNDISIGDRKVSGNAFYHLAPSRNIVHGTMLYDIDPKHITNAITPARAKLESHKVTSVQSRITTLRAEGLTMGIREFVDYAIDRLTDGTAQVSPDDIRLIEQLAEPYMTESETLACGRSPQHPPLAVATRTSGNIRVSYANDTGGVLNGIELHSDDMYADAEALRALAARLDGHDAAYITDILSKI